jgi:hypothetical protein
MISPSGGTNSGVMAAWDKKEICASMISSSHSRGRRSLRGSPLHTQTTKPRPSLNCLSVITSEQDVINFSPSSSAQMGAAAIRFL